MRTPQGIDHSAQTRDVSASGIFLYTKSRMEAGAEVELVLLLPPELTSGEKCWVCCQATIVRVEEEGKEFGVAAQIKRMDILPAAGQPSGGYHPGNRDHSLRGSAVNGALLVAGTSSDAGKSFAAVPVQHGDCHDLWIDPADAPTIVMGPTSEIARF